MVQLKQTNQKDFIFRQAGFTLLEVLVALSVVVMILTAFSTAVIYALSNAIASKQHNLATKYANQAMEIVKQTHDADPTTFHVLASSNQSFCLNKGVSQLTSTLPTLQPGSNFCAAVSGSTGNVDNFNRKITFYPVGDPANQCNVNVMVKAVVAWEDTKCNIGNPFCHNVTITSCFNDPTPIAAP